MYFSPCSVIQADYTPIDSGSPDESRFRYLAVATPLLGLILICLLGILGLVITG
jgi:hypothetical protein